MSTTKLITMYLSPWSERVRWALAFKGLPYEKENYEPGVDEETMKKLTGQAMVPVLVTDGKVIPDSSAILEWLEETDRSRRCYPDRRKTREVTLWEEVALNVLGPHGRDDDHRAPAPIDDPEAQKSGKYFAEKYGYSAFEEEQSRLTVTRILTSLKETLSGRQYLVGDTFTRADITTAAMLMLFKAAPQEFFVLYAASADRIPRPARRRSNVCRGIRLARPDVQGSSRRSRQAVALSNNDGKTDRLRCTAPAARRKILRGREFCIQCATPFKRRCQKCAFDNPVEAKFCTQCATLSKRESRAAFEGNIRLDRPSHQRNPQER